MDSVCDSTTVGTTGPRLVHILNVGGDTRRALHTLDVGGDTRRALHTLDVGGDTRRALGNGRLGCDLLIYNRVCGVSERASRGGWLGWGRGCVQRGGRCKGDPGGSLQLATRGGDGPSWGRYSGYGNGEGWGHWSLRGVCSGEGDPIGISGHELRDRDRVKLPLVAGPD